MSCRDQTPHRQQKLLIRADAFFAPICTRLLTYALPVPDDVAAYVERVCALPGVKAWMDGACAEHDFLDFEEPYRLHR